MKQIITSVIVITMLMACSNRNESAAPCENASLIGFPEQIFSKTTILNPSKKKLNKINDISTTMAVDTAFVNKILDQVLHGKIKVFKEYDDTIPVSYDKLESVITVWDSTNLTEDPYNPGTMISAPLKITMSDAINEIRFIEDWKYDFANGNIIKKVIAYALIAKTNYPPPVNNLYVYFWVKNF